MWISINMFAWERVTMFTSQLEYMAAAKCCLCLWGRKDTWLLCRRVMSTTWRRLKKAARRMRNVYRKEIKNVYHRGRNVHRTGIKNVYWKGEMDICRINMGNVYSMSEMNGCSLSNRFMAKTLQYWQHGWHTCLRVTKLVTRWKWPL